MYWIRKTQHPQARCTKVCRVRVLIPVTFALRQCRSKNIKKPHRSSITYSSRRKKNAIMSQHRQTPSAHHDNKKKEIMSGIKLGQHIRKTTKKRKKNGVVIVTSSSSPRLPVTSQPHSYILHIPMNTAVVHHTKLDSSSSSSSAGVEIRDHFK